MSRRGEIGSGVSSDLPLTRSTVRVLLSRRRPGRLARSALPPRPRRPYSFVPGLVFLSPWLIGFVALTAGPMFASLYLSFTDYDLLSPPEWIGAQNYVELFTDDDRYRTSVVVTLSYVALSVPLVLASALAVAMLLVRQVRGIAVYRAVFYLPSLLGGSVAIAILWRQLFGRGGVVSDVLGFFGVTDVPSLSTHPDFALLTLVTLHVWQFGAPMVIFIVGLKQIPQELYEAAEVDGASRWQRFLRITLPLLSPVIFFNLVLQTISSFKAFTPAFVISGGSGAPADSTLFYTLYLYIQGFGRLQMGYASAMAWILLVAMAALTAVQFLLSRRWVYYVDDDGQTT